MAEDGKKLDVGLLISADSHVMEAPDFWAKALPAGMKSKAPVYGDSKKENPFQGQEGAREAALRVTEMAKDGVSGEVLYPTRALHQYGMDDVELQEACFKVYNDWLLEYCAVAPDRLFGVACISAFRIKEAIKEMERCKKLGMKGIMIWQAPPDDMSFASRHHDPLFEAAQALEMPVSLHILTGAPYKPGWDALGKPPVDFQNFVINDKLHHAVKTLIDIVVSGTLDRFPDLKIITVENEVSWQPFVIWQMEKYAAPKYRTDYPMKLKPSEYFKRNLYTTFFNDPAAGELIEKWGADTWMWSNDYPHPNSTWPNSRDVIRRDLGHLSESVRAKVIRETVARLYKLPKIMPLAGL